MRLRLQALARALGFSRKPLRRRDLSEIAGTWREDPEFDRVIEDQHSIDHERILREFLLKDGVKTLHADDKTTHHYASIFRCLSCLSEWRCSWDSLMGNHRLIMSESTSSLVQGVI